MKKLLALLLTVASLLTLAACDTPPAETTNSETTHTDLPVIISPSDPNTAQSQEGLHMEAVALGMGDGFLSSNEPLLLQVTLTNTGEHLISQWLPTYCRESNFSHNHELDTHFTDGKGHVLRHDEGDLHPEAIDVWWLAPGETETFLLTLLPSNFDMADETLYTDGVCTFSGTVSFSYYIGEADFASRNDKTLTAEVSFTVKHTAPSETTHPQTTPPETTEIIVCTEKPVIYLYPEKETEVTVRLDYKGELLCTYPAYEKGWHVLARPNGTLTNLADGKEYSYLFWDGYDETEYDLSRGFCVRGEDTAAFLQDILGEMGLTPREYNEFIVYWLPRMQNNPYNLITFQREAYTDIAPLTITPTPDSLLRVFMVYQPLTEYAEIEAPEIETFTREGFTVIEWGGKEVR